MTTTVFIECGLPQDGSIQDGLQNQIVDTCRGEGQQALDASAVGV